MKVIMFEKLASHPRRTRRKYLSKDIMNNRDSGINPGLVKLEVGDTDIQNSTWAQDL